MTLTNSRSVLLAVCCASGLLLACTSSAAAPTTPATTPALAPAASIVSTFTPIPPTGIPVIGFTPESSPRDANGVPLPNAAGARNVVVTYTPPPSGGPAPKSGNAIVSVGDNYFYPDELHVTPGTTIEWRYDGGGGETESTHNVIAVDNSFSSGDLNAGLRYAFEFLEPGEFAYLCSYHAKMTGK